MYFVRPSNATLDEEKAFADRFAIAQITAAGLDLSIDRIAWTPTTMLVYGRVLDIPRSYSGLSMWTFEELCGSRLGPADYITLASTYHTLALIDVPVLTTMQ